MFFYAPLNNQLSRYIYSHGSFKCFDTIKVSRKPAVVLHKEKTLSQIMEEKFKHYDFIDSGDLLSDLTKIFIIYNL
jgi:hypothetical protein